MHAITIAVPPTVQAAAKSSDCTNIASLIGSRSRIASSSKRARNAQRVQMTMHTIGCPTTYARHPGSASTGAKKKYRQYLRRRRNSFAAIARWLIVVPHSGHTVTPSCSSPDKS